MAHNFCYGLVDVANKIHKKLRFKRVTVTSMTRNELRVNLQILFEWFRRE